MDSSTNFLDKREKLLAKYQKFIATDSLKARKYLRMLDFKDDAYLLRCIAITYRDESIFNLGGTQKNRFNQRKLSLAKKYIDRAYEINPDCRDVLYVKGTIYSALNDIDTAVDCYIAILEREYTSDVHVNCAKGDGAYIKMVLNDSYFQLYRLYHDKKVYRLSKKFLKAYKDGLSEGINTLFKPIEKYLKHPRHISITGLSSPKIYSHVG